MPTQTWQTDIATGTGIVEVIATVSPLPLQSSKPPPGVVVAGELEDPAPAEDGAAVALGVPLEAPAAEEADVPLVPLAPAASLFLSESAATTVHLPLCVALNVPLKLVLLTLDAFNSVVE